MGRVSDLVTEMATARLLRDNPFRLLRLPTDASGRQLKHEAERLEIMQRLGAAGNGPDATGEALHRLRDPLRRILDELLWFWPDGERPPPDVGDLTTLAARARRGDDVAQHNLAVLQLLRFVEGPEQEMPSRAREALVALSTTLAAAGTLAYVTRRMGALDDPRLRSESPVQLVDELGRLVPLLGARLAVRMLQEGPAAPAVELATVIRAHSPSAVAESVFREALDPLVRRVRNAVSEAEKAVAAAPRRGATFARQLLDQSADERATIEALQAADNHQRSGMFDAVAGGVVTCAGAFYNETFEAPPTRALLLEAQGLDPGPATQSRIDEGMAVVGANESAAPSAVDFAGAALALCWYCLMASSSAFSVMNVAMARVARDFGVSPVERDLVPVPRCLTCLVVHARADRRERIVRRSRLLALVVVLAVGLASGWAILQLLGILFAVFFVFGRILRAVRRRGPLFRALAYPAVQTRIREGWLVAPRYSGRPT